MYTIFFDLDGVLADCKPEAERLLGRPIETDEDFWSVGNGDGFFENLPVLSDAYELLIGAGTLNRNILNCSAQPFKVLTATGHNYVAVSIQKRKWVAREFRSWFKPRDIMTTRKGTDKAAYAHPTHILIDDTLKVIEAWEAAGGIGILHTDARSTLEKLENILLKA